MNDSLAPRCLLISGLQVSPRSEQVSHLSALPQPTPHSRRPQRSPGTEVSLGCVRDRALAPRDRGPAPPAGSWNDTADVAPARPPLIPVHNPVPVPVVPSEGSEGDGGADRRWEPEDPVGSGPAAAGWDPGGQTYGGAHDAAEPRGAAGRPGLGADAQIRRAGDWCARKIPQHLWAGDAATPLWLPRAPPQLTPPTLGLPGAEDQGAWEALFEGLEI